MIIPLWCLLGFVLWTGLLVGVVAGWRVYMTVSGQRRSNSFSVEGVEGPDWYQRAVRVHQNCVENLPLFGSVVLIAAATGEQSSTMDNLAIAYLVFRLLQSGVHLGSTSVMAVNVRFTFFLFQHLTLIAFVAAMIAELK